MSGGDGLGDGGDGGSKLPAQKQKRGGIWGKREIEKDRKGEIKKREGEKGVNVKKRLLKVWVKIANFAE